MQRQVTVSRPAGSRGLKVENRLLNGTYPSDADMRDVVDVPEVQFLESLQVTHDANLLPPGVLWMSADGKSLLIHEPPARKRISMRWGALGEFTIPLSNYDLPMPDLVYGISPASNGLPHVSHIWAAESRPESWESRLYWIPLPNMWHTGAICTHTLLAAESDAPYHWMVNLAINEFWSSIFNLDVEVYRENPLYCYMRDIVNEPIDYHGCDCDYEDCEDQGEPIYGEWFDNPYRFWESLELNEVWRRFDGYWQRSHRLYQAKELIKNNSGEYAFGGSEAERLMAVMIAKSYENTMV